LGNLFLAARSLGRAAMLADAGHIEDAILRGKQLLTQTMLFKQMAKAQQRGRVRNLLHRGWPDPAPIVRTRGPPGKQRPWDVIGHPHDCRHRIDHLAGLLLGCPAADRSQSCRGVGHVDRQLHEHRRGQVPGLPAPSAGHWHDRPEHAPGPVPGPP
jgi:hypothetical protein